MYMHTYICTCVYMCVFRWTCVRVCSCAYECVSEYILTHVYTCMCYSMCVCVCVCRTYVHTFLYIYLIYTHASHTMYTYMHANMHTVYACVWRTYPYRKSMCLCVWLCVCARVRACVRACIHIWRANLLILAFAHDIWAGIAVAQGTFFFWWHELDMEVIIIVGMIVI